MLNDTSIIRLLDDEFVDLRDVVYSYCGLYFDSDKKYLLQKRLSRRLQLLQLPTFRDYCLYLKFDKKRDEEMATVVELLTTNETYFFREKFQLDAFKEEIVPDILSRKRERKLRIWSAGCSTGEEPYTIAIIVDELMQKGAMNGWSVEILGSDISHRVLGVARHAVYSQNSFRDMDPKYFKYFEPDGGKMKLCDRIKDMVTFTHVNLLDVDRISLLKKMDVIFCRNVAIYFDSAAKRKVFSIFYERLEDEGYLLLGHSESLMNITTQYTLRHFKKDMVYQKPSVCKAVTV